MTEPIETRIAAAAAWARREQERFETEASTKTSQGDVTGLEIVSTTYDTVASVLEEIIEPGRHSST